jgi:predicted Zn-dependent protease
MEEFRYIKERMACINQFAEKDGMSEAALFCRKVQMVLCVMMKDFEGSAKVADAALQIDPDESWSSEMLEQSLRESHRNKEADQLARDRCEKRPTARSHYKYARCLFENRHEKEAEVELRAAMKLNPEDAECILSLAAVIMKTREDTDSLKEAEKLLDQIPPLILKESLSELVPDLDYYRVIQCADAGAVPRAWGA